MLKRGLDIDFGVDVAQSLCSQLIGSAVVPFEGGRCFYSQASQKVVASSSDDVDFDPDSDSLKSACLIASIMNRGNIDGSDTSSIRRSLDESHTDYSYGKFHLSISCNGDRSGHDSKYDYQRLFYDSMLVSVSDYPHYLTVLFHEHGLSRDLFDQSKVALFGEHLSDGEFVGVVGGGVAVDDTPYDVLTGPVASVVEGEGYDSFGPPQEPYDVMNDHGTSADAVSIASTVNSPDQWTIIELPEEVMTSDIDNKETVLGSEDMPSTSISSQSAVVIANEGRIR